MSLGNLTPTEYKNKIKSQSGCLREPNDAIFQ